MFTAAAELAKFAGYPINEANSEIETQPLTAEMKRRKYSK